MLRRCSTGYSTGAIALNYFLLYIFFLVTANDPLSHLKNKDADSTNPNLYHCIDDDKMDHVYDEIKHKEGFGEYLFYFFNSTYLKTEFSFVHLKFNKTYRNYN